MFAHLRSVLFVSAALVAQPLWAQETTEETPPETAAEAEAPAGLSMGETIVEGRQLGEEYILEPHGDWAIRCITTEQDQDPCQLYQLLLDGDGNSVAEISMFPLRNGGKAAAGATIVTPLETMLTEQVTIQIDQGAARRYPFTFCAPTGCFARIGLTAQDIANMKAGAKGTMSIVPAGAPDSRVNLAMSLSGFTAGYAAIEKLTP